MQSVATICVMPAANQDPQPKQTQLKHVEPALESLGRELLPHLHREMLVDGGNLPQPKIHIHCLVVSSLFP